MVLALTALVWIVFGQTAHFDWVRYDDHDYVYRSGRVTSGLSFSNLAWAFTHFHAANWHPITTLSHMLDCQLFGVNPAWHHFSSVVIHALATIALFFALDSLTRKKMAKRICRRCLRHSSATRGIGGLDRRAQRRSQRFILRPHPAGVVLLCAQEISDALSARGSCGRAWNALQTDASHDSVRTLVDRLLAVESFSKRKDHLAASGENSVRAGRRSLGGRHGAGPTRPDRHFRLLSAVTIRKFNR